jgi:hypothetical protein
MRAVPSSWDRLLRPVHRWVWRDVDRRARKLLRFAETEANGGRDLARAAELTGDALLRRLFLRHAADEQRHADLFRDRGRALRAARGVARTGRFEANWLAPGERGLDRLRIEGMDAGALLSFLHCSEKTAAGRFALYRQMLGDDPATQAVFSEVLHDEEFHMTYTRTQLGRVAPARRGLALWRARAGRLWKAYLRVATGIASVLGAVVLTVQYFVLIPPFALLARRAARRDPEGWRVRPIPTAADGGDTGSSSLESQY